MADREQPITNNSAVSIELWGLWWILGALLLVATQDECSSERANIRELHCPTVEAD